MSISRSSQPSDSGARLRLAESHQDKSRAYIELGKADLAAGRLQSAESFLRLAAAMDPTNAAIKALLTQVVSLRTQQR